MIKEPLPDWENKFFADITVETVEANLKKAERLHEAATYNYFNSIGRGAVRVKTARKKFLRSLRILHWAKESYDIVLGQNSRLRQVTTGQ